MDNQRVPEGSHVADGKDSDVNHEMGSDHNGTFLVMTETRGVELKVCICRQTSHVLLRISRAESSLRRVPGKGSFIMPNITTLKEFLRVELVTAFIILYLLYSGLVAIYRLFLHPLAKFPGSNWAAVSRWYVVPTTKALRKAYDLKVRVLLEHMAQRLFVV